MVFFKIARAAFITVSFVYFTAAFTYAQGLTDSQDSSDVKPSFIIAGDLDIFESEEEFNLLCTGLSFEDFEDTNVGPDSGEVCPNPFDSNTNNQCFSAGALIPGFAMNGIGGAAEPNIELAVITPTIFGATQVAAGANARADDTEINFIPTVGAVGLLLYSREILTTIPVRVYGPGNTFLGATSVIAGPDEGTFIGIRSDQPIEKVSLGDSNTNELVYELSFGDCGEVLRSIPTMSEWGLIATAGILGLAGLYTIRRRRAAA